MLCPRRLEGEGCTGLIPRLEWDGSWKSRSCEFQLWFCHVSMQSAMIMLSRTLPEAISVPNLHTCITNLAEQCNFPLGYTVIR